MNQFAQALASATMKGIDVTEQPIFGSFRADGAIKMEGWPTIVIEHRSSLYPRDAREFLHRVEEATLREPELKHGNFHFAMVSERISESAREFMRERGLAYYDGSGSMHISSGEKLIHVDRPPLKAAARQALSIYLGATGNVVLALIDAGKEWRSSGELAVYAETSSYTVSITLKELERLELLESKGQGRAILRRLAEPNRTLTQWAEAQRTKPEPSSKWYLYAQGNAGLTHAMDRVLGTREGVAITGPAAANCYAAWLTNVETIDVVVPPGESQSIASELGLKSAQAGANVRLIERTVPKPLTRHDESNEWSCRLVAPAMAYADCLDGRGRNKELAEHLRAKLLTRLGQDDDPVAANASKDQKAS